MPSQSRSLFQGDGQMVAERFGSIPIFMGMTMVPAVRAQRIGVVASGHPRSDPADDAQTESTRRVLVFYPMFEPGFRQSLEVRPVTRPL